jgi:hypothetical protein
MKHLFNDLPSEEKNRILEMHKTASDKHYLLENLKLNDVLRNVDCAMENKGKYEPTLMGAWERCKKRHQYVRLKLLGPQMLLYVLVVISLAAHYKVGGPYGLIAGGVMAIFGIDHNMEEIRRTIAKSEPESESLKQEIVWLYECLRYDEAVMNLLGEELSQECLN